METQLCLTVEEAAHAVGLSRSKVYAEIAAGSIAVVRIGRSVRVRKVDLESWIDSHLTQPDPTPTALLQW